MEKPVFWSLSRCFQIARVSTGCLFFLMGLTIAGCGGPKVVPREVDIKGGVKQDEEATIRGYLDAAGVNGQIVSIQPEEKVWIVEVGGPPGRPGQRQAPVMPNAVRVDRTTGKVTGGGDTTGGGATN